MAELTRRDALALAATLSLQPKAFGSQTGQAPIGTANLGQLLKRDKPERYSNQDLRFIGMPVGGCFAGTLYLGGDGQLWNWDIFNVGQVGAISQPNVIYQGDNLREQDGANYVQPPRQVSPFRQRFELFVDRGQAENRAIPTGLSVKFGDITFRGEYPIGRVEYRKGDSDVEMDLEAFSPFIPLDIDRSSYPATTLTFTVRNVGNRVEKCHLSYAFENPVLCHSKRSRSDFEFQHQVEGNRIVVSARSKSTAPKRSEIVMETWASGTYGDWKSTGTAFGTGPQRVKDLPAYMGTIAAGTEFVVNTHQTRNGENVVEGDVHTGTLTSPPFVINREFLSIRVGGGGHAGGTCVNLLVNGNVVRSLTGDFSNRMSWKSMNVKEFEGQTAVLQIVDSVSAGWGQISVGEIIQTDVSRQATEIEKAGDFGEFGVEILQGTAAVTADRNNYTIRSDFSLNPGESKQITFLIAWRFPNKPASLPGSTHWYATKWKSVGEVLTDLRKNWKTLSETTRLWNKTWYDSSLPHWFLDRTFVNTSTLATTTCHRLDAEGRFYFWEGVGCCAGTCTHVWGYAQAIARVFPQVERYLREKIDYGAFFNPSGAIDYRGEFGRSVAHDGQISCVLRSYREHLMSKDGSFLSQKWPAIKKSLEWVINEDKDADGILEGGQYNTLDAAWYGPIAWISSLYVAALRAGEAMAKLMNDEPFAQKCGKLAKAGSERLVKDLYNGEFFINKPDPAHPEANNTNIGCHIDQLYGQFWTHQLGLQPVVPAAQAKSAMAALYKHNFYNDIWEYRRKVRGIVGGRWYAMPGEPGLVMCSFPNGGAENATGKGQDAWAAAYFNECMSGFEYQAAATMISQGLVKEGLSVVRAIHDRYSGKLRNPFNEVECSDHYGRAMASYGAYLALTGMQIDSPNRVVTVAPKVSGGKVRCAFIDAHGWGTIDNTGGPVQSRIRLQGLATVIPKGSTIMQSNRLSKAIACAVLVTCVGWSTSLARTVQTPFVTPFEGEWVFVDDRTPGRSLEQLNPPMSLKFAMKIENNVLTLMSGHGSGQKDTQITLNGSHTDVPGTAPGAYARYRATLKDGVLAYEVEFVRSAGGVPQNQIKREFRITADGLEVRSNLMLQEGVWSVGLYKHPQDIPLPTGVKATINQMSWLSGNWSGSRGANGAISMEERWSPAKGGSMLAVSRTVSRERLSAFEYLRIVEREGSLVYIAQPNGLPATEFVLTEISPSRAVFENPRHDYPKKIVYELSPEGVLSATVGHLKGGTPRRYEYRKDPAPML